MVFLKNIVDFELLFSGVFERTELLLLYYNSSFVNSALLFVLNVSAELSRNLTQPKMLTFQVFRMDVVLSTLADTKKESVLFYYTPTTLKLL